YASVSLSPFRSPIEIRRPELPGPAKFSIKVAFRVSVYVPSGFATSVLFDQAGIVRVPPDDIAVAREPSSSTAVTDPSPLNTRCWSYGELHPYPNSPAVVGSRALYVRLSDRLGPRAGTERSVKAIQKSPLAPST